RLYLAFLEAPPFETTKNFILLNIALNIPQHIAVKNNTVIGWCDVLPLQYEGFRHRGKLGMGVDRNYRRQGIGKKLITQTLQEAKKIGIERVELEVYASNIPALSLYKAIGFETECMKTKARKLDGEYDDIIEMVLFV
ncbi:MAG TPA: GNAT family N-acetyltransferase, partial [Bacteroidota bacterium]|nr:GNAT family N-acetyltransferase [Bacteroidota bacterium]